MQLIKLHFLIIIIIMKYYKNCFLTTTWTHHLIPTRSCLALKQLKIFNKTKLIGNSKAHIKIWKLEKDNERWCFWFSSILPLRIFHPSVLNIFLIQFCSDSADVGWAFVGFPSFTTTIDKNCYRKMRIRSHEDEIKPKIFYSLMKKQIRSNKRI